MSFHINTLIINRRAGLVQLVSASSPSHQVLGSTPSLCRISARVRLCFGYSLPQTPLVWEPLALGLPFTLIINPRFVPDLPHYYAFSYCYRELPLAYK
jgi:hypothetical protein